MKFARIVFLVAGVAGVAVLAPLYFLEGWTGRNFPPAIAHPEYYYGFVGVALVCQILFLVIASDPIRYRPLMIVGALEKASYSIAVFVLFAQKMVPTPTAVSGAVDFILGLLFVLAYIITSAPRDQGGVSSGNSV